jgi:DNA (cytosine-5)-methyltransferase 1
VDSRTWLGIELCAGFGMLGEAVRFAFERFGIAYHGVAYVEWDVAAASALLARLEAEGLDHAAIWDDLTTFAGKPWRGKIHCLSAGLPCPAFSSAGKRKGNDDHRAFGEDGQGPQAHALRIIGEVQPAMVFLENVPEWVTGGSFRRFGEQLSGLGYTIEDPIFLAAEDFGAPHERERVFIMAHRDDDEFLSNLRRSDAGADGRHDAQGSMRQLADAANGREWLRQRIGAAVGAGSESGTEGRSEGCTELGNAEHCGATGVRGESGAGRRSTGSDGGCVELGDSQQRRGQAGYEDVRGGAEAERGTAARTELRRGGIPLFPPGRGDPANPDHPDWWAWAAIAAVDASLMPRVEPELSMVADGLAFSRADLLRIGGNGVVVLAAAYALCTLLASVVGREVKC